MCGSKRRSLQKRLADPEIVGNPEEYMKIAKSASELEEVVQTYQVYKQKVDQLNEVKELLKQTESPCLLVIQEALLFLDDAEMEALAQEEMTELQEQRDVLEDKMRRMLLPKDPLDERNIVLEVHRFRNGVRMGRRFVQERVEKRPLYGQPIYCGCINGMPPWWDGRTKF